MRTSFTFCFIFLAHLCWSQWQQQNSGTSQHLRDLYFISASTGYAVGDNGTILKSVDGGSNWALQPSPTTADFSAIKFADMNTGYITAQDTFFLKTTDGGANWTLVQLDTIKQNPGSCFFCMYNLVDFYDSSHGLIVLSEGQLTKAHTTDGGAKWNMETEGLSAAFTTAMSWPVMDTAYTLDVNRKLAMSTNGGVNWTESTLATGNVFFYDVNFMNGKTGFVTGERAASAALQKSFINKTVNAGASWQQVLTDSLLKKRILSMDVDASGYGIAVGSGVILSTNDLGDTWAVDTLSFPSTRLTGARITVAGAFAVGDNGMVLADRTLLAVSKYKTKDPLKLYPNPAPGGILTIERPRVSGISLLTVYTITGQEVFRTELIHQKEILRLDLAQGIYYYNLRSGDLLYNGRLCVGE